MRLLKYDSRIFEFTHVHKVLFIHLIINNMTKKQITEMHHSFYGALQNFPNNERGKHSKELIINIIHTFCDIAQQVNKSFDKAKFLYHCGL